MAGLGTPARGTESEPGQIREFDVDAFEPSPLERDTFGQQDRQTPALVRLIQEHRSRGRRVAVLYRRAGSPQSVVLNGGRRSFRSLDDYGAFVRLLMEVNDPAAVRFSTTHGYKGQEAHAVILWGVTADEYPLVHPTWPFFQVFGDTVARLVDAERRLFYVGVSRGRSHLDVVTKASNPSAFWTTSRHLSVPWDWEWLAEARLGFSDSRAEIRVYNSAVENFEECVRQLKGDGFRFRPATKCWWKLVDQAEVNEKRLMATSWARHGGIRLEVWHQGRRVSEHRVPGAKAERWPPY